MDWSLTHIGEMGNAQKILVGKAEGKPPLEPRRNAEDNIKIEPKRRGLRL
jgi:hypothetical protein